MTSYRRLIARLDCKGDKVIKGIQLEGLRVVGPINEVARARYSEGADELVLIDAVASLYEGSDLPKHLEELTRDCFVPITVGGGIRQLEDADRLFRAGADKVAINSGAIMSPTLISELAYKYGSQAVVIHIEAKRLKDHPNSGYTCFVDNGRDDTGREVSSWVSEAVKFGAGEVLVTSVDRDGTLSGPEISLLDQIRAAVNVPVVASGGFRGASDVVSALKGLDLDGVAIGAALHSNRVTIDEIRKGCIVAGVEVR
jgi:cyclase